MSAVTKFELLVFPAGLRKARPQDLPRLTDLALEALAEVDTGTLVLSRERIVSLARTLVSDPSGLVLVDVHDGVLTGAIALSVSDGVFFERKSAGIIFWYSRIPRRGYVLLRQALQWVNSRPSIKAVGFAEDFVGDRRVGKLLERAGLKYRGSVYAKY